MFEAQPSITHLPATRDQVVAVVESINQPQVSVPGKSTQAVSGYLCGVRNANGTFGIVIGLHLPRTGENVIYLHARRQLTLEEYRQVELEGLQFLESMGFMVDNLNFRNLSPELQDQVLRRIPLFAPPRPPSASSAAPGAGRPAADPVRLARLLASF